MPGKKDNKKKPAKKKTTKTDEKVVQEDSLVYVDYIARSKDDSTIFDLTLEDVAKEEGLYKENGRYEPMLVAIGHNWLLGAVEEELVGMKVGETKTIEVPPEKGAGQRDPKKVKMIAKAKLAKHDVRMIKGEEITFGNERGIIKQILGRRVRVDFNSPLAGKTLVFDVTLKDILLEPKEKLMAVLKRRLPGVPEEKCNVSIAKKSITFEIPFETRYVENINYAEIGLAMDALKVIPDAKDVKLVTKFERPEPPKETG